MDHTRQINGGGGGGGVTVCRPSGTRWTPTSEQIRILRDLYYNCGIRSPNSEQIQRIAAMLRQYGRIEGKNVFYWFQNHKARERQKRRLTTLDVNTSSSASSAAAAADGGHLGVLSLSPSGAAPPSPTGLYAGHGAAMAADQRSFLQDYMGVSGGGGASPWARFSADQRTAAMTREPETLPLFPTDGGGQESIVQGGSSSSYGLSNNFQCWGVAASATTTTITVQEQRCFYSSNHMPSQDAVLPPPPPPSAAATSLELSLSSYCSSYPGGSM